MTDAVTQVRAILKNTFGELAQVIDNESIKGVLEGLGDAIAPAEGNGAAPSRTAQRGARSQAAPASAAPAARAAASAGRAGAPAARAAAPAPAGKAAPKASKPRTAGSAAAGSRSGGRSSAARATAGARAASPKSAPRVGRREQLLAIIVKRPGVTIAEAAKEMGVSPTGLYPVANRLQTEGLVRKDGTGWVTREATPKR